MLLILVKEILSKFFLIEGKWSKLFLRREIQYDISKLNINVLIIFLYLFQLLIFWLIDHKCLKNKKGQLLPMGKNSSLSKTVLFVNFRKFEIRFQCEILKVNIKIWGHPHNTNKLKAMYYSICARPCKKMRVFWHI